jgi:hypothetical protein
MIPVRVAVLLLAGLSFAPLTTVRAQEPCDAFALNLTVEDAGVSIGDAERTTGVRLNFGDRCLQTANGINATLFPPFDATGTVNGLALGLPLTGSSRLRGLGVGVGLFFGNASTRRDGGISGVLLGGIATVAESRAQGLLIGGLGAGIGDSATGVVLGGGTAVATGSGRGLFLGGLAAGTGGPSVGLLAGGLGAGTTGTLHGAALSLGAVGAGNRLVGLGAAGGYVYVGRRLQGITAAAVNHISGTQHGLTIGLFNYARKLDGVQIGLLNVARNNPVWATLLPGINLNL